MDQALYPQDVTWHPVSPRLVTVRRTGALLTLGLVGVAGVAVLTWLSLSLAATGLAVLVLGAAGWQWWVIGRTCRSWGYAERDDDLLVRHGLLIRRLSVVPYGRMQFIDVTAGPLERRLGMATVHLHTAAAASDARIPGLPQAQAALLRDRLASLGEARAAGL